MILLQAAMGLAVVFFLIFVGGLLIGIPVATYLLNRQSRKKMNVPEHESLSFKVVFLNFLGGIIIAIIVVFVICFGLNMMIDWRLT